MRKVNLIIIFVFYLLEVLIISNLHSKIINEIAVKVGNSLITSIDVQNEIITNLIITNQEITQKNVNNNKNFATKSLIYKLIKKSEIDIRYVPTYKYNAGFVGKGSIGLWGVGFKHDILQWIPLVGDAFPMSLSLQAGHTSLNTDIEIKSQVVAQNL